MAGGGTGGHVYPAIAIARAIRSLEPEAAVEFAGTRDRLEWTAVPMAGYAIHPITASGFHRRQPLRNVSLPFKLVLGLAQSFSLVRDFDADVVVGTGGYVSGPVLMAASWRRRPIVAQEQNAYAGVTNRLVARRAAQIHVAFPEATKWFPKHKCRLSGNPVRRELTVAKRDAARRELKLPQDSQVVFVFGGSLGSKALNTAMERHAAELLRENNLHVVWQTGRLYSEHIPSRVDMDGRLRVVTYVDRMDLLYAASDLVLCRAGAITCSELLVTGTPAILVPSPHVAEDHQTKNAESMQRSGAAIMVKEPHLTDAIRTLVPKILRDPDRRRRMAEAARAQAKPGAAMAIARDVLRLAGWRANGSVS